MRRRGRPALRLVQRDANTAPAIASGGSYLPNSFQWSRRVYAIAFDLDTEMLDKHHPGPYSKYGYEEICRVLEQHGFARQQGSVYFSQKPDASPVTCVLAVQ